MCVLVNLGHRLTSMDTLKVLQTLLRLHSEITLIKPSIVKPNGLSSPEAIGTTVFEYKAVIASIAKLLDEAVDVMAQKPSKAAVYRNFVHLNTTVFQELKEGALDVIGADIRGILADNGDALKTENAEALEKALADVAKSEARLKRDKESLARAHKRVKLIDYAVAKFPV